MFTLEEFVCAESVYKLTTSRSVCSSQCTQALTGTKVRTSIGQVKRWLFTLVFFSLISGASATKEASTEETVQCWLYIYLYIYIFFFLLLEDACTFSNSRWPTRSDCPNCVQQQWAKAAWDRWITRKECTCNQCASCPSPGHSWPRKHIAKWCASCNIGCESDGNRWCESAWWRACSKHQQDHRQCPKIQECSDNSSKRCKKHKKTKL